MVGWKEHFGPNSSAVHAVATGADGRIAIAGRLHGPVDFGPAGVVQPSGSGRGYTLTLDRDGHPLGTFATEAQVPGNFDQMDAAAFDSKGNLVALGQSKFGAIVAGKQVPPSGFLVKVAPNGTAAWSASIENSTGAYPYNPLELGLSVVTDVGDGIIVAASCYADAHVGSVAVSPPPIVHPAVWGYLCLFSLDGEGKPRWGRSFTSDGSHASPRRKVAIGPDGNIYIAGRVNDQMDLGDGPVPTPGQHAVYVLSLSPTGNVLWSRAFGGKMVESASLGVDASGRIVLLFVGGGDVSIDGTMVGGGEYVPRSVLVWLDSNGTVLRRRSFSSHQRFDTLSVGEHGIAMLGAPDGDMYRPTLLGVCNADATTCKVGDFGESWTLYHDLVWHSDGDVVVGGTLIRETASVSEMFASVGKFHFE